jgi:type I restriction enzyme S subunit
MTNFSGNHSSQNQVNAANGGPQGEGMDSRRNQAINQVIPEGYKQTEIGVVPDDWDVVFINDVSTLIGDGIHSTPVYDSNGAYYFVNGNNIDNGSLRFTENTNRVSEAEYNKHKKKINDRTLLLSINGTIGNLCFYNNEPIILGKSAAYININHKAEVRYMYQAISFDATQQRFEDGLTGSTIKNLGLGTIKSTLISLPSKKEQTAIANALSDVDTLLSELENLIAKKQAIKTATMQQLLTGKTRLPQFAFYSDINSTEGAIEGKRNNTTATIVNAGPSDDGSLASQDSRGMDSRRKGTKTSELGEIPEDWDVKAFGQVMCIKHGKDQKAVQVTDGLYPIFGTGGKMGTTNTPLYAKPSVLIGRKGTINKPRYADTPFWTVDTLFYSEISPKAEAKFLFYKFCMIDWMQYNEASGVPSLNASTIENVTASFPSKEEQTAIASILSDMDNEIQTLEQRLSKTRQIKQGMMQELLTGKTRLPFDKIADKE